MNPFKLCREGTTTPVAQACGACGTVYHLGDTPHGDTAALRCCDTDLQAREKAARDAETTARIAREFQARVAAAARVPEAAYTGPVCADDVRPPGEAGRAWPALPNDGYLESLDALREWFADEPEGGRPLPAEVWACTRIAFELPSADEIIERALESGDYHEDMRDWVTGEAELQAAIDAFNAAQTGETWHVDSSRRVVLAPAPAAAAAPGAE